MSIDKVRGTDTLTIRLTKEDRAALDELVEAARVELEPRGVVVSAALYVRGWIRSTHAAMVAKRNQRSTYESALTLPATALAGPAVSAAPAAPTEAAVRRKLLASKRTGADLARLTGIDPGLLSRFRSGKKSLSPEKLARLADELGR